MNQVGTNLAATSREYKLLLHPGRLRSRRRAVTPFRSLIELLTLERQGSETCEEQDELSRRTWAVQAHHAPHDVIAGLPAWTPEARNATKSLLDTRCSREKRWANKAL